MKPAQPPSFSASSASSAPLPLCGKSPSGSEDPPDRSVHPNSLKPLESRTRTSRRTRTRQMGLLTVLTNPPLLTFPLIPEPNEPRAAASCLHHRPWRPVPAWRGRCSQWLFANHPPAALSPHRLRLCSFRSSPMALPWGLPKPFSWAAVSNSDDGPRCLSKRPS
jgi:hypothetical protein